MLPPDFEERKRGAKEKSARMRALSRLRLQGLDPDAFPYQFLTTVETTALWDSPPANVREERVPAWGAISAEVAAWARGLPEVAVFLGEVGYCVLPGSVVAASIDVFRASAMNGRDFYVTTPDGRSGRLYDEDEHANSLRSWDAADCPLAAES